MTALLAAAGHSGRYLHWGVLSMSLANALVIAVMVLLFVLAMFLPLGRHRDHSTGHGRRP